MTFVRLVLVLLVPLAASLGCRAPAVRAATSQTSGTTVETLQVHGETRTYRLHLPANASLDEREPLVLNFHGLGGTGVDQEMLSGMSPVADAHGYAVAYPDGIDRRWHFSPADVDDLAFVDALINHLVQSANVDPTRVYATGISDGGFFSIFLACQREARVAAIAPVAASLTGLQALGCASAPRIPGVVTFGTEDPIVPWVGNNLVPGRLLSVTETISLWAEHLGVADTPTLDEWLPDVDTADGTRAHHTVYGTGELALYAIEGGGHTWPGGVQYLPVRTVGKTNRDYSASEAILTFFDAHRG